MLKLYLWKYRQSFVASLSFLGDTVAEWLRCWLLSVSELNRPRFESRSGHYSAIRLDRLSQGLPGLHPSKQGRTLGTRLSWTSRLYRMLRHENGLLKKKQLTHCALEYGVPVDWARYKRQLYCIVLNNRTSFFGLHRYFFRTTMRQEFSQLIIMITITVRRWKFKYHWKVTMFQHHFHVIPSWLISGGASSHQKLVPIPMDRQLSDGDWPTRGQINPIKVPP